MIDPNQYRSMLTPPRVGALPPQRIDALDTLRREHSRIAKVYADLGKAVAEVGAILSRVGRSYAEARASDLRERRTEHGGNGSDAARWPKEWQSSACSAWLHPVCPSDRFDLSCTCTCHGAR